MANRGEFGKAWAAFSPSAPADGRDPKVVANYLGKTTQARAPPASVTADEPGVARYELRRKFFNKFAKSLPRARKGGPTQVDGCAASAHARCPSASEHLRLGVRERLQAET